MDARRIGSTMVAVALLGVTAHGSAHAAGRAGHSAAASVPVSISGGYVALQPSRILDTRYGVGVSRAVPVPAHQTLVVHVAGHGGVPTTGVSAVVLNLTEASATAKGYITAFPTGQALPTASNLNHLAANTAANLVNVRLGVGGEISLYNGSSGSIQLIADVSGYFTGGPGAPAPSEPGSFVALPPTRIMDTRIALGARTPLGHADVQLTVAGHGGVPSHGVAAVVMNVTATAEQGKGFLSVFPYEVLDKPAQTSSLNYLKDVSRANLVTTALSAEGQIGIYVGSNHSAQLVADVEGYYLSGTPERAGTYVALAPERVLDTRYGNGAPARAVAARATTEVGFTAYVPAQTASAVVMNLTVTEPQQKGYLTAYPYGRSRPLASNLNFPASTTVANLVTTPVGTGDAVSVYNGSDGTVELVADVDGYYLASDHPVSNAWEWDQTTALGDGLALGTDVPSLVPNIGTVTAVVGGLGLRSDGTVVDPTGQIVPGLSEITELASAVGGTSYALRQDGTVWAWGNNSVGQLGDGSTTDSSTPVEVTGLTDVVSVGGGYFAGYAVRSDGTAWAWGYNGDGELGNGTLNNSSVPVDITALDEVASITGGRQNAYALMADGTVQAWGENDHGQLGIGSTVNSDVPVPVTGLSGVTGVSAGAYDAYAVRQDGTAWAWGAETWDGLGTGATLQARSPVQITGLSGVVTIVGAGLTADALASDGTVWAWGTAQSSRFPGIDDEIRPTPARVGGITLMASITGTGGTVYGLPTP